MGNSIGGGKKMAKVMKVDGVTIKLKTPMRVREILKDYPGHVLIESEAVKKYGIRAKPLEVQEELKPRKVYFLLELPKLQEDKVPRRVKSGIQMSAKDKLENLMLTRRCASDLSIMKTSGLVLDNQVDTGGAVRVRMRLPKNQVAKLVEDSKDATEAAEKIVALCLVGNTNHEVAACKGNEDDGGMLMLHQQSQWKPGLGSIKETFKLT